jgi:hypothetical protein
VAAVLGGESCRSAAERFIARRRARWKSIQPHLDPGRLVFIDETWIKT